MSVHSKILNVMKEVEYMSKDDNVSYGQTKYRALSEEKVTSIMHKQIVDAGLVVYPINMAWSRTGNITHVDVTYRICDADNPKDFIEVVSCGDGADTQDKGSGKAMTYAFKYMWLRTFAIPTGEDPDKVSSAQLDDEQQKREAVENMKISDIKVKILQDDISNGLIGKDDILKYFKVKDLSEVTEKQFSDYVQQRNRKGKK